VDKISKLQKFCSIIGYNLDDFLLKYQGVKIPKTNLDKHDLFKNLILHNLTDEQNSYIKHICNLPNRDSRTPQEYAKDLVISWLVEDIIQDYLNLKSNGADKDRVFLHSRQIKYDSDFMAGDRLLELYVNFTNYWTKTRQIDLRMDKYSHLVEKKSLLLGIAFEDLKFYLIDFGKSDIPFYENYNYFWKKKCYTCKKFNDFHDLSFIKEHLLSVTNHAS